MCVTGALAAGGSPKGQPGDPVVHLAVASATTVRPHYLPARSHRGNGASEANSSCPASQPGVVRNPQSIFAKGRPSKLAECVQQHDEHSAAFHGGLAFAEALQPPSFEEALAEILFHSNPATMNHLSKSSPTLVEGRP